MISTRTNKRIITSGGSAAGVSSVAMKAHRSCFIADISFKDLERMRAIVRKVHLKHYRKPLSDHAVDRIIEGIAPESIEAQVKAAVDSKYLK